MENDWTQWQRKRYLKICFQNGNLSIELQKAFIQDNENDETEQPEPIQLDDEDVTIIDYEEEQQDEDTKESPEQISSRK